MHYLVFAQNRDNVYLITYRRSQLPVWCQHEIFYWRTREKDEIDFVLYGEKGLHAFEIKRKAHLTSKDFKALKLFAQDYPPAKLYMLYGGSESYYEGEIRVEPFTKFIMQLNLALQ